jgi:hypothetical protein
MEDLSEMSGYVGPQLGLLTFVAKDMRVLRTINLTSSPTARLSGCRLVLLPLNIVRLAQIVRATPATADLTQADGAVRAQTLCTT